MKGLIESRLTKVGLVSAAFLATTPLYAQMSDLLQRQLSGLLTEKRDPDQAMDQLQGATLTLLRSAGGVS